MAYYFINGANKASSGTFPYNVREKGAKNFYELLIDPATKINLMDNDYIRIFNPVKNANDLASINQYSVVDTSYDININVRVNIVADSDYNVRPKIYLKPSGNGIKFEGLYANGSVLKHLHLYKTSNSGKFVYVLNTNNININDNEFSTTDYSNNSDVIKIENSTFINTQNNIFNFSIEEPE
jgi:hypothetical protein